MVLKLPAATSLGNLGGGVTLKSCPWAWELGERHLLQRGNPWGGDRGNRSRKKKKVYCVGLFTSEKLEFP